MSKKNSIFSNVAYLFISNVFVRFFTAIATIMIARYLGAEDYGVLSVALAYASVAAYFTDLGLTHTLIREGTKDNAHLETLMSSFLKIRIVLSLLTILFSILIIELLYDDPYLKKILYIVLIPTILGAALQGVGASYYQVIEKMHITALIRTIAGLSTAIALTLGMIFKWPLTLVAPVYGLSGVLAGIFSILVVMRSISIFKGWDSSLLKGLGSFTLSGLTIMLLPQLGPIILERAAGLTVVGFFSAAYRIPAVLYQIPGVVAAAFYPILFRLGNNKQWDEHYRMSQIQLKVMSFLGISMAIPFLFYSKWWIEFLFGKEWLSASAALSILSFMVILQSINYPLADALTTKGHQNKRSLVLIAALLLGAISYAILGMLYGSSGGAAAAVLTEIVLLCGFLIFLKGGTTLLYRGFLFNLIALVSVVGIYYLIGSKIHPLAGSILLVLLFLILSLLIDVKLRKQVITWTKNRLAKRRNVVKT